MNILIVKLGSIGDIVHTLPTLAAVRSPTQNAASAASPPSAGSHGRTLRRSASAKPRQEKENAPTASVTSIAGIVSVGMSTSAAIARGEYTEGVDEDDLMDFEGEDDADWDDDADAVLQAAGLAQHATLAGEGGQQLGGGDRADPAHPGDVVAAVADAQRRLREAGAEIISDPRPIAGVKRFYVRDPGGNLIEITEA